MTSTATPHATPVETTMANDIPGLANLSVHEQDAFALSRAAILLDQARDDDARMAAAMEHNLELWTSIQALVRRDENPLPAEIKDNLVKLSRYVADATFRCEGRPNEDTLKTLININLQISQGLLESAKAS